MESLIFLQTFGNGASGFIDGDIIIGENLSQPLSKLVRICLLYTSDAADE